LQSNNLADWLIGRPADFLLFGSIRNTHDAMRKIIVFSLSSCYHIN